MVLTYVSLVMIVLAAPAGAQEVPSSQETGAQEHVDRATSLFEEGRFEEALKDLAEANELHPMPVYVYNMARCYEELNDIERTVEMFERYLAVGDDDALKKRAKRAILQLRSASVGTLDLSCTPAGAAFRLGKALEGTCPYRSSAVPGGLYALSVRAEGHRPHDQQVQVLPGEMTRIGVTLVAMPGMLLVESPEGIGAVYVDDTLLATLPMAATEVSTGRRKVRVEVPGEADWTTVVDLAAGSTTRITAGSTP